MSSKKLHPNTLSKKIGKTSKKKSINFYPSMNTEYSKDIFKNDLKINFTEGKAVEWENKAVFDVDPFSVCVLPNFVTPVSFVEYLNEELADQIFYEKNNDLYKFQQTDDLKKISSPYIKAIRNFLCGDVREWLCEVTGLPLTEKVDSTCSRYDYTDVLLCHDDELDSRRIAFVYYLVPAWKNEDGGLLNLYNMDAHLQPKSVVKSISPAFNQFLWFEVTEASHHQVSEVLCQCKSRLSINGWFHAPPAPRPKRYIEPRLPLQRWTQIEEDVFYEWINPIYLDPEVQSQIQEKFENDSEIELQGFIQEEKYQILVEALKSNNITWKKIGPPNKRQYDSAVLEENSDPSLPVIIKDCLNFLKSEMMFLTLSNLTGLTLHPLAADSSFSESDEDVAGVSNVEDKAETDSNNELMNSTNDKMSSDEKSDSENVTNSVDQRDKCRPMKKRKLDSECKAAASSEPTESKSPLPQCRSEVRRWKHEHYTLIHDTDTEGMEFALDAMLYCSCKDWDEKYGGYTSYIAKGEEEELLTVLPSENSLALVYRDKDTLRFVKHINDSITTSTKAEPQFYDFSLVYFE